MNPVMNLPVKHCLLALMLVAATGAAAATPAKLSKRDYPSCDLVKQRALKGETGGKVKDPRQAHILQRGNVLQADIATAREARHLSQKKAQRLWRRVEKIEKETNGFVARQGFLSAAERASYDRELDAVAEKLCG